jgi:hypothetical protein
LVESVTNTVQEPRDTSFKRCELKTGFWRLREAYSEAAYPINDKLRVFAVL